MMRSWPFLSMLLLAAPACVGGPPVSVEPEPAAFELRAVQLPGSLAREDLVAQLDYLQQLGFNALWVRAGQLTDDPLAETPSLHEAGRRLAAWSRRTRVALLVALDPSSAGRDRYALSDSSLIEAIGRFSSVMRRQAACRNLILSFEEARPRLRELRDVVAYGFEAAPAHADLAARLRSSLPRSTRLWFHPAPASGSAGLESVAALPASVGLVWQVPADPPAGLAAADVVGLRRTVGERAVLLRDPFPANQAGRRMPLSHNLGPLRERDADLASAIDGYVAVAMTDWSASRLTLITVADWLRSPGAYEADPSWERAMRVIAGEDARALEALRTQALEWGGSPGRRNHRTAETDNPTETARVLRDPALISRWRWTLTRYPGRMEDLRGLADEAFRDELLDVMARRLAIAQAIPSVREILARQAAGRSDLGGLIAELNRLRVRYGSRSARVALDRFLAAGGVLPLLDSAEDSPAKAD